MAQSKFAKITSGQWEITLTTKILHSRSTSGRIFTETCSALSIQPSLGFQGPYIAAFFGASADVQRTITINPIVTAYNLVDDHAEVFRFVKDDDLDGLMKHLAFGRATIRDCDKIGRSLLHVRPVVVGIAAQRLTVTVGMFSREPQDLQVPRRKRLRRGPCYKI